MMHHQHDREMLVLAKHKTARERRGGGEEGAEERGLSLVPAVCLTDGLIERHFVLTSLLFVPKDILAGDPCLILLGC